MADKKISQLTGVSTPLSGTEEIPAVQSSTTKKVTIAQLQATPVSAGTANSVQYLNTNKVPTTTSSFSFDGKNLGVNTTLVGADSRFTNLEIGEIVSLSSITVNSTTQLTYLQHNSYVDSGGNTKFKAAGSNYAMQYSLNGSTHNWQTSTAAGVAGDAVSYNNLMQLAANGNLTVNAGNLVIGTSGKGIDFSATSDGSGTMTSELLADYEEGTWTPTQGAGLTVVGTFSATGSYTKIGRQVTVSGIINGSTSVACAANSVICGGLPYTANNDPFYGVCSSSFNETTNCYPNSANLYITNVALPARTAIYFSTSYFV